MLPDFPMKPNLSFLLACAWVASALSLPAAELSWHPDANMDSQLFPSLLLATATVRPGADEENDPEVLGDAYGAVGISITSPAPKTAVKVTLLENSVMNQSSWSGVLDQAEVEYWVAPTINYKFDALRRVRQQVPLNVTFRLEVAGKIVGEQTQTVTLRTINDCPFGVADKEQSIRDEPAAGSLGKASEEPPSGEDAGYTDMGWMFAAYVNENGPIVEQVLKEGLRTGVVDHFAGYQGGQEDVVREVLALWTALQKRGIKYSNITTTAGTSETVLSQHVRFVDESVANEQANCVDGSVLFASLLRKLGMRPFLVIVPGHMFMGFYLDGEGEDRIALETTLLGSKPEKSAAQLPEGLRNLEKKLGPKIAASDSWKTFAAAVVAGTANLQANAAKFEEEDSPEFQIIDLDEARKDGIMPIAYLKEE